MSTQIKVKRYFSYGVTHDGSSVTHSDRYCFPLVLVCELSIETGIEAGGNSEIIARGCHY